MAVSLAEARKHAIYLLIIFIHTLFIIYFVVAGILCAYITELNIPNRTPILISRFSILSLSISDFRLFEETMCVRTKNSEQMAVTQKDLEKAKVAIHFLSSLSEQSVIVARPSQSREPSVSETQAVVKVIKPLLLYDKEPTI